jgi:hypothetical protein
MDLLSSFGKKGVKLNLLTFKVDINDTAHLSTYFNIVEFNPLFTAGRNSIALNGSALLKDKSEILVECLDSRGQSLFIEQARSINAQYSDVSKFLVSVNVFDEAYNGPGKLIIVGTTVRNELVKWIGNITIDKTVNNLSKVRFYSKPSLEARSLLYPVVDTTLAQVEYPPPPAARGATAIASIYSRVFSIGVTNAGSGYTSASIAISGGGGGGASANASIVSGSIASISVVDPGNGYTSNPVVSVLGDGTNATANSTIQSTVQSIGVTDAGSGYSTTPNVTISGGGSGATATAVLISGSVASIGVTNGGNGYVVPPIVSVEAPLAPPPPELNVAVTFSSSFTSFAANPPKDTNQSVIDPKRTNFDYRIILSGSNSASLASTTFPIAAFNTQMESQPVTLHIDRIQLPLSYDIITTNITASGFTIKNVLDSATAQLNLPFFYAVGKNNIVANIVSGRVFCDYRLILYNTNPDSQKTLQLSPSQSVSIVDSYAEILYRNIRPFSGFIARHKLYRKSAFSTGDYTLVSDDKLSTIELLSDPVTFNKFYDKIGVFYHQPHINKYWWPSSNVVALEALAAPINSMLIFQGQPSSVDGTQYIMAKNDSIGVANDNIYHPYVESEFNNLSGPSYNSNFVSLIKNSLYQLTSNVIIIKDVAEKNAKVSFYFTSSVPSIAKEPGFTKNFGMLIGEISTKDQVDTKYFSGPQTMSFSPQDDYFGTLVIVPHKCNCILSEVSLMVYGDHGFSPDILFIRIPWDVRVKNEAFNIKAELLDINSNVVYTKLATVESFDPSGQSLYASISPNQINTVVDITEGDVTFTGNAFFPNLSACDNTTRFVGWHVPIGDPDVDGMLCYTNVQSLIIDSGDYISLTTVDSGVTTTAKSIAVRYDFAVPEGRKIFIDQFGSKQTFP